MKDIVWLHAGSHKTGTTAIQTGLQSYDDGTTRYARLGLPNHGLPLSVVFRDGPDRNATLGDRGIAGADARAWMEDARQRLQAELTGPGRNLILSAESLSLFPPRALQGLKDALDPHAREVRVLVYVRDPVSFASSIFGERIKNGATDFTLPKLTYRARLAPALQVFGPKALQVVRFDRDSLRNGDVIDDFCARVGIDRTRVGRPATNERLSAQVAALLYFWNRTPAAAMGSSALFRARYEMISELAATFPGRLRLSPDLIREKVEPGDIDWLARTFGIDFAPDLASARAQAGDVADEADFLRLREQALPGLQGLAKTRRAKPQGADADAQITAIRDQAVRRLGRLSMLVSLPRRVLARLRRARGLT